VDHLQELAVSASLNKGREASQTPERDEALPRRDWLLLPSVVLSVTIVFLALSNSVADRLFPESGRFTCTIRDQLGLLRQKPNCVCHYKNAEGPVVEYRFNECGYRSAKPCRTKPRDTLRVVLMGASVAMGLYIRDDETFATRTEAAMNRICGRSVEVQNMGGMVRIYDQSKLVGEALGLSPDVIVLTVGPYDLEELAATAQQSNRHSQTLVERVESSWRGIGLKLRESKLMLAAGHFMLLDDKVLYQTYLSAGGSRDVMSSPQTPAGKQMYAEFAKTLDRLMAKLNGSGVPVVIMAVPNRVAAAMVSNHSHLDGTDPRWFGYRISEIAVQQGALALDVTPEFANFPHAEQLFYPVDNHPTGDGHAVIAQALVGRLTDGSIPQLAACRASQRVSQQVSH
jgi:acetyltransferase AlgX (SGNH hydrolase-like protein)